MGNADGKSMGKSHRDTDAVRAIPICRKYSVPPSKADGLRRSGVWPLRKQTFKRRSEDDRKLSDTPEGVKSRNRATRTQRPTLFYLRARNYRAERYGTRYGAAARIQFHDLHTSANTYYIGRVFRVMGVAWQLKNGVSGILQQQVRAGAAGPATRCGTSSATARTGPTS